MTVKMTTVTREMATSRRLSGRKSRGIRICGSSTYFSRGVRSYGKHLSVCESPYSYFFMPIVFPQALVYIMVMMLVSIDFWVVKNIVGRKLLKWRWWYMIDGTGNE